MQAVDRYTRTAVVLHWTVAALMIGSVVLAWTFDFVAEESIRTVIDTHKAIGLAVFGLVVMRILWRATHPPPPMPSHYRRWERTTAHLVHGLLYALMLALPVSGWLHDSAWRGAAANPLTFFGLFDVPRLGYIMALDEASKERLHGFFGLLHDVFGYVLYAAFALHVGGALKHQWLDRDPEIERMSLGRREPP